MRLHSNTPIINHNGDERPLHKAFEDIFIPYVGGDTSYKRHMKDFLWRHGEQVRDALESQCDLLAACKEAVSLRWDGPTPMLEIERVKFKMLAAIAKTEEDSADSQQQES